MQNSYLSWSWTCYPYVNASPYSQPVPSGFAVKAESEVRTGYVFSQGALAADTLVQRKIGDGRALARARCEPGLLPGLMAVDTRKLKGLGSKGLE